AADQKHCHPQCKTALRKHAMQYMLCKPERGKEPQQAQRRTREWLLCVFVLVVVPSLFLLYDARGFSKTGLIGQLLQAQDVLPALPVNEPRRIRIDIRSTAFLGLRRTLSPGAALDVRQPVGGPSEDLFLLLAMWTPISAIELGAGL